MKGPDTLALTEGMATLAACGGGSQGIRRAGEAGAPVVLAQSCHVIELVRGSLLEGRLWYARTRDPTIRRNRGGPRAPAYERPSADNGLHRREQLACHVRFHDVAASPGCDRGIDDLAGVLLAEKQDSQGGILGEDALR